MIRGQHVFTTFMAEWEPLAGPILLGLTVTKCCLGQRP